MDKSTSVLAALDAGKLPTTAQTVTFINWFEQNVLGRIGDSIQEQTSTQLPGSAERAQEELTSQGRVLASDLNNLLEAYKALIQRKNADNILQQALFHLTSADLTVTPEAQKAKDDTLQDLEALRSSFRTLLISVWESLSAESGNLFSDFLSLLRVSLADVAESIETRAEFAKETLREVESGVQKGERDSLGRDRAKLKEEEEGGARVRWEHGVDTVKDIGSSLISTKEELSAGVADTTDRATTRVSDAWIKITDRAQKDPNYKQAIDTIFSILQKRINQTFDKASDPNNLTFSAFLADPTPEQHLSHAVDLLCQFVERLSGMSLDPLMKEIQMCARTVFQDDQLKVWFNNYLEELKKQLSKPGYPRTDDARKARESLQSQWCDMLTQDERWKRSVDGVKSELRKVMKGIRQDAELQRVDESQSRFGQDLEKGLHEVGKEAQSGVHAAVEQATWFWQDLFRVYLPRAMSKMRDVPIPRTEYKDNEIEFVLENLDVSSFNILPSHVYIRNITDIDIDTAASGSAPSRTAVGTLTHIRIQAVQMSLKDISFWYKDKTASSVTPSEFTGLLGLELPKKGIDVDIQVRLIPANVKGPRSRENLRHFNILEKANVTISDDVNISVRDSNHTVLMTIFRPIMMLRLKEALERTLSEQVRGLVERADGVAWDVACRQEVFKDTGLGGGGSLVAAIWSELGRMRREAMGGIGFRATGTGIVFEQKTRTGGKDTFGELGGREEGMVRSSALAMGAEPQILSGEKRGPLGTGSEPLREKVERLGDELGVSDVMDVDEHAIRQGAKDFVGEVEQRAKGMVDESKKQWDGFKRTVDRKRMLEAERPGWQSAAFDF